MLTEQQKLDNLKKRILRLKKLVSQSKENLGIVYQRKKKLAEFQTEYRKLYMKIYSKNYYKNKPEVVIKAVKKYKKTAKGKITRSKYQKLKKQKSYN